MKKLVLLLLLASGLVSNKISAQALFNTMDSVDINNITAAVLVHGDMWWDPVLQTAFCKYPAHSPKNVNFAASIWMSAYDGSGGLHVAAQTYRQGGNDYWPGPLDGSDTITYATSQNWDKIWKVNRTDIQYFQMLSTHTVSNTPQAILTWPAKGNAYAAGYGGISLTISNDMAPFVDLNGNGIYEPLLGEYPDVPGDQALWWVFSDNGPTHSQSNSKPLGVEMHMMAYAYSRGSLIDDVIYYDYTMVNRSINNYQNVRVADWDDVDLGWYYDDFIGFDSTWRMGIGYNGTTDDGAGGGYPVNSYGLDPPQVGVTMIVLPGDDGSNYVPAGNFIYYNNNASIIGYPDNDTVCNYYLRAMTGSGIPIGIAYAGTPPCASYGPTAKYIFPGDPSDTTQWSECSCHNNPSDRRFVMASNDFTLNAGNSAHFVFALVVADSAGGGCGVSFNGIKAVADTAWNIYHNPLSPLVYNSVGNVQKSNIADVRIYPNPANDVLNIASNERINSLTIIDLVGQTIYANTYNAEKIQVDVADLPKGIYLIRINGAVVRRFVKE